MNFALQCLLENHTPVVKQSDKEMSEFKRQIPYYLASFLTQEIVDEKESKSTKINAMRERWARWVNEMSLPFAVLRVLPKDIQKRIGHYVIQDNRMMSKIYTDAIKNSLRIYLGLSWERRDYEVIKRRIKEIQKAKIQERQSNRLVALGQRFLNRSKIVERLNYLRMLSDTWYISEDYSQILEAVEDKFIYIRDIHSKLVRIFKAHNSHISRILLTTDQKYIISVANDKTLKLWDFYSLQEIGCYKKDHIVKIMAVENNQFILLNSKNRLMLWDIPKGIFQEFELLTNLDKITHLAVNKKHNLCVFAFSNRQNMVGVWNFKDGKSNLLKLPKSGYEISSISTYDDKIVILLWSLGHHKIEFWDLGLCNKQEWVFLEDLPGVSLVEDCIVLDGFAYEIEKICAMNVISFLGALVLDRWSATVRIHSGMYYDYEWKRRELFEEAVGKIAKICDKELVEAIKPALLRAYDLK